MTILATCATVAAAIAANPGATVSLKGQTCADLRITAKPAKRVTVNAGGSTIRSLRLTGGNLRWRGGTIRGLAGYAATGPAGYGLWLNGATGVRIDGVTFTDARKGVVIAGGSGIVIADSRFTALGEDGIIAAGVQGLTITRNRFSGTRGIPGGHNDAVQLRDAVTDALIEGNDISGATQGITQMDAPTDRPLVRVTVRGNTIRTDRQHKLTMYRCTGCRVAFNIAGRAPGSTSKPIIIAPTSVLEGNVVEP